MLKSDTIGEIALLLNRYPVLEMLRERLVHTVEELVRTFSSGGKLLICGNGGSAADSLHITGELMKSFVKRRPLSKDIALRFQTQFPEVAEYYINNLQGALPAISLVSESALMTAYGNDNTADLVFAQQVFGYGKANDVLLAISTSGNSGNVLHAARVARAMGLKVISLTGEKGGALAELSDILLDVPSSITHQIQELHLPVYHTICLAVETELFEGE